MDCDKSLHTSVIPMPTDGFDVTSGSKLMNGGLRPGSRVLLVHSADEAYGSDRVLVSVAEYLRQADARVRAVLPDDTSPGWLTERLTEIGVDVRRGPLGVARRRYLNKSKLAKYVVSVSRARRFLRAQIIEFDPEAVHLNTSALIVGAFLGRRRRWSLIWHVHEIIRHPRGLAWVLRRLPLTADHVIAVSEAVLHNLCGSSNFASRVTLLRNGIAPRALHAKPNVPPLRVCFAGRLSEWKGYRVFVDAAIELASRGEPIEFVIAGDPLPNEQWRTGEIESTVARRGVSGQIKIAGFCSNIPELFDGAHIVVVPSILPDPLPTVVLEGMRSGCVVIAARHGGAVEMIEDGLSGFLVPPGDSESLQDTILRVLADPRLVDDIGGAAWTRVASEFTTDIFWQNLSAVYYRAIDLASTRRRRERSDPRSDHRPSVSSSLRRA